MTRPFAIALLLVGCTRYPRDFDGDGYFSHQDCNDKDPTVNIMAEEIPFDGKNNDCDTSTLDDDGDQDGIPLGEDCDDTDPTIPVPEIYYDGIDNDCSAQTIDDDQDGDGVVFPVDCDDTEPLAAPGNVEVPGDGVDNDCNPATFDGDLDLDGVDGAEDCNDADPTVLGPTLWFVDCDADGFAEEGAFAVEACDLPPADASCLAANATWTDLEPIHVAHTSGNTTTDCADDEPLAFPGQPEYFGFGTTSLPIVYRFDFDCNGSETPQYGLFTCYANPAAGSDDCIAVEGFLDPTTCGGLGQATDQCEGHVQCSPFGTPYDLVQSCK